MKYNYVFFDNNNEYYQTARFDLKKMNNCIVRTYNLPDAPRLLNIIFKIHTGPWGNNRVKLPFQKIWRRQYTGNIIQDVKPYCFVFCSSYVWLFNLDYFNFLRKKYPGCALVFHHRDLVSLIKKSYPDYDIEKIKKTFDLVYTTNTLDANKYGLKKINAICSYVPVEFDGIIDKDVVFIGRCKGREQIIIAAYNKFTAAGYKCDFRIVGGCNVSLPAGISSLDKPMTYQEMLQATMKAKCVFEVTQNDTDAMTSRCLEAFCYDKLLITDNKSLRDTRFFNTGGIYIYKDVNDIPMNFLNTESVSYHYAGEYSPIKMLEKIDDDLVALNAASQK